MSAKASYAPLASLRVAFLGLGYMGSGMAANLARRGANLTVWNRSPGKCHALVAALADTPALGPASGAAPHDAPSPRVSIAASAAEAAAEADVVCVCLASEAAGEAVLCSPEADGGVFASAPAGAVVVDHSTVSPAFTRRCAAQAAARGLHFLDAPISGGPEGARDATLAIMCGGAAAAFTTAEPVLRAMGRNVVLLGGTGAGTAAKLANQLLVGVHAVAAAEALALARSLGLTNTEGLARLLAQSYGNSRILQRTAAIIVAAEREAADGGAGAGAAGATGDPEAAPAVSASAAPLRLLAKDLGFVEAAVTGAAEAGGEAAAASGGATGSGALSGGGGVEAGAGAGAGEGSSSPSPGAATGAGAMALPLASLTSRIFSAAVARGQGESDMARAVYWALRGELVDAEGVDDGGEA